MQRSARSPPIGPWVLRSASGADDCFAKIHQKELAGEDEGRLTYLWLIILVLLFMLYGLYAWGVYPLGKA
jgi:hypothetical protein